MDGAHPLGEPVAVGWQRRQRAERGWLARLGRGLATLGAGLALTAGLFLWAHLTLVAPVSDGADTATGTEAGAGRTEAAPAPGRTVVAPPPANRSLAVPPPYTPPPAGTARDVTPSGLTPGPQLSGPLERVEVPAAARAPAEPARERFRRVIVVDGSRIRAIRDDKPVVIAIDGVTVPAFGDSCRDKAGASWRCGAEARADLARLIGSRDLLCTPAELGDDERTLLTACAVGRFDLATWLAARGWGKPDPGAGAAVKDAAAAAEAAGLGIWR